MLTLCPVIIAMYTSVMIDVNMLTLCPVITAMFTSVMIVCEHVLLSQLCTLQSVDCSEFIDFVSCYHSYVHFSDDCV